MGLGTSFLKQALLGLSTSVPWTLPKDIQNLLDKYQEQNQTPEKRFLLAAGLNFIYERAGWQSSQSIPTTIGDCPSEKEGFYYCSPTINETILGIMRNQKGSRWDSCGQNERLLIEAFQEMEKQKQLFRPSNLPDSLYYFSKATELHPTLCNVLGMRAAWLATFVPAWSWILESQSYLDLVAAENTWNLGESKQRLAVLKNIRQYNPQLAKQWLEKSWNQESSEDRFEFLEILENNLSHQDLDFLEKILQKDGSRKVKILAAKLLSILGNNAFVQRMKDRADLFMQYNKSLDKKNKNEIWTVNAENFPKEIPKGWLDDGIQDSSNENGPRSKKETWAIQILEFIEPKYWEQKYQLTPKILLERLKLEDKNWYISILVGLSRAAVLHKDTEWMSVLWDIWQNLPAKSANRYEQYSQLIKILEKLPSHIIEKKLLESWKTSKEKERHISDEELVKRISIPWTKDFCQSCFQYLQEYINNLETTEKEIYNWNTTLFMASIAISQNSLDDIPSLIFPEIISPEKSPKADASLKNIKSFYEIFLNIIELRKKIIKEIRTWHPVAK